MPLDRDVIFLSEAGEEGSSGIGIGYYGIGSATDSEDAPKGFGAHSDQERILESELHRFVRFNWDVITNIAGAK